MRDLNKDKLLKDDWKQRFNTPFSSKYMKYKISIPHFIVITENVLD